MKVATAQYPITFHQDLKEWEIYFEKWILKAVQENAQVLLFPEVWKHGVGQYFS